MRPKRWAGFRSVVCPIDFSESSRLALRYASAIAARAGAPMTVLYASDPLLVAAAAAESFDETLSAQTSRELQRFIATTLPRRSLRGSRLRTKALVGTAADEILKTAAAAPSPLIVMGTHGLTRADRMVMGSSTLSVLQRSQVPVLAVPLSAELRSNRRKWPGERIIAAIELHSGSRDEVDAAAAIAQWFGSSLLLVHVVREIDAPSWLKGTLSAHERIRVAQAQRRLDVLTAIARQRVHTEARLACGHPADEIAAIAAAEDAALLMTTLRDRRGWFGARRGSISYHVLSHAVVPVLACPRRWQPR